MKNKIKDLIKKAKYGLAFICMTFTNYFMLCSPVFAEKETLDAKTLMGKVIGIIVGIAKYGGYCLLAGAIISYIYSHATDETSGKTRTITLAICGIVLVCGEAIIGWIVGDEVSIAIPTALGGTGKPATK